MVIVSTFNFPNSNSSVNAYMGSVLVPYDSTNGNKQYNCNTPVSFKLNYTNYSTTAQTITVTFTAPTLANVYKNGSLIGTTTIGAYPSVTTKSFTCPSSSASSTFSFDSYFMNIFLSYNPAVNNTFGTTDTYDFYAIMNYTLTSTKPSFQYIGNYAITYGWVMNTTTSTSAFSNFAYASGSSDSSGYSSYYQYQDITLNSTFDGTVTGGYTPPVTNTYNWTGIYTLFGLYLNQLFVVGRGIVLKQTVGYGSTNGSTQSIQWVDTDANGGGAIALVYGSTLSNALNFSIQPALTNGFIFNEQGNTLFQISAVQTQINYNGSAQTITLPSSGVFMYVFGSNYSDTNITATTFVSGGGVNNCRLFNQYLPSGFGLSLTVTGASTFTIVGSYPSTYNSFSVRWVKIA
jgi:hypothetical protein